jgi:NADPH:quinone reductase-like Zn-dependent oxidoreductase
MVDQLAAPAAEPVSTVPRRWLDADADEVAAQAEDRWGAAVDSVGGQTLANIVAQTAANGAVAACGLAGGNDLPGSVFPFILRGVALLGIDSVYAAMPRRVAAWNRLDRDLDREYQPGRRHAGRRLVLPD